MLGGLNEGTWPPESRTDAWLSRPMRLDLGLDLPERRIGLSAHDFAQLLGAPEVILSRAAKIGGAPTVPRVSSSGSLPSPASAGRQALERGDRYLVMGTRRSTGRSKSRRSRNLHRSRRRAARPTRLSVTAIEDWLRDPYTIYAKHILQLRRSMRSTSRLARADRGTVIHAAVGDFTKTFADGLPSDPAGELIEMGEPHFATLDDFPEARAFWWPRYKRIAAGLPVGSKSGVPDIRALLAEIRGKIEIPLGRRRVHAERHRRPDRASCRWPLRILDYKTGAARTEKQVRTGLAPQLTLEAAMLRSGGFPDIAAGPVAQIGYVLLKGGSRPAKPNDDRLHGRHAGRQADHALAKSTHLARDSPNKASLIVRSSIRCGRTITATTIISRASRNGRRPAARLTNLGQRMRAAASIPSEVRRKQSEASDPEASAWVAANAGSGKTHVLASA